MTEIEIYTAKDGHVKLDVNLADETVWLSMSQMVELFARDKSVISRHLNNVFTVNKIDREETVAKYVTVQKEGDREVKSEIEYNNLDAIISVGYRVNSKEGVQFRKWAKQVLKEHQIRINAIVPGLFYTDMTKPRIDEDRDALEEKIPLGFIADPNDLDAAILFLSSNAASRYMTGTSLIIDGGVIENCKTPSKVRSATLGIKKSSNS